MPKKNSLINNTPEKENEIIEDELTPEKEELKEETKTKRTVSDAQRAHLNNIRGKALEKKAQMKEETLKGKLAKVMEKKELVKKYDTYVEQEQVKQKEEVVVKPKKEKKIIYKYASSSDSSSSSSDDNEDEKIVYVKKCKKKNKKDKPQPQQQYQSQPSLDSTLYKSSQEMLHHRAIEERVKSNLIRWNTSMMPQEY